MEVAAYPLDQNAVMARSSAASRSNSFWRAIAKTIANLERSIKNKLAERGARGGPRVRRGDPGRHGDPDHMAYALAVVLFRCGKRRRFLFEHERIEEARVRQLFDAMACDFEHLGITGRRGLASPRCAPPVSGCCQWARWESAWGGPPRQTVVDGVAVSDGAG